jgi:hypothetical protein
VRPALTQPPDYLLEHGFDPGTAVGIAGAQDHGDELAGLTIEDEQGMEHVLAVVAMIGAPFLLSMGGIIRAIEVEDDAHGNPIAFPLAQIDLSQGHRQPVTGAPIDSILQS